MKKHILAFILTGFTLPLSAQTDNLGTWNILNVRYGIRESWSIFMEGQIRSLRFYDDFHYYEYKGGINYKAGKSIQLTLGAGSYQTYKEGGDFVLPKNNDEFRVWPQITVSQTLGKFKMEHRYRFEARYTSKGYRNRFRYRTLLSYPFGKSKNEVKPFQASISNELFFTNKEPYFERNRFLIAMGYRINKLNSVQVGYLRQFDYKINDETGKSFFQIGWYFDL
ncbi:MAG: DUF2490 domain-containing protein [Bacteroidota bacterium]